MLFTFFDNLLSLPYNSFTHCYTSVISPDTGLPVEREDKCEPFLLVHETIEIQPRVNGTRIPNCTGISTFRPLDVMDAEDQKPECDRQHYRRTVLFHNAEHEDH
ncbi:uncharacterized protein LOC143340420 [Colletes latitarsis]|uniref:uncharacterized protein LOC143340420 n=1 Tax=Colletes latitarsis TaxID=2605962 RepID=UPI0040374F32